MTKYKVTAQAYNRKTRKKIGKLRTETIDTKTNVLFKTSTNTTNVKRRYESFWNKLNPKSKEVVYVSKVVKTTNKKMRK